jgi:16S rRNA (cytidine1402-2'-O)-methyltransferase
MSSAFGPDRPAFIGRELSKLHEQCVAAPLGELVAMLDDGRIPEKGEFVIVVAGATGDEPARAAVDAERLLGALIPLLPGKQAVEVTAAVTGENRNAVYRRMLELTRGKKPSG